MAKFFEQVKTLMSDVESFMGHVKDTKLSNKAKSLKLEILQHIHDLREDHPQLGNTAPSPPSPRVPDPEPEDPDDIYEDADNLKPQVESRTEELLKKDVPASDRNNVNREGNLKYRKEKKLFNKVGVTKSKQWCVLRNGIFYIYDKKSSKKQTECFFCDGYQVTPMEQEGVKKDVVYPFEMTCDGKKTYVFEAPSSEEQSAWVTILHQITGIGARDRPVTASYDDDGEVLYEDTDEMVQNLAKVSTSDSPPPALPNKTDVHTGRKLPVDPTTQSLSSGGQSSSTPSGESMADNQDLYDETQPELNQTPLPDYDVDDGELYDETIRQAEGISSPPANKSTIFSDSHQRQSRALENEPPPPPKKALPPPPIQTPPTRHVPPVPQAVPPSAPAGPSPADMYYALWDCTADNPKELSLTRGDVVTVLSKKYEDKGWWVSRLNDKVGLVPREYLTEAYERT